MQATPELLIYLNRKLAYRFVIATRTIRTIRLDINQQEISPFALAELLEQTSGKVDTQVYFKGKRVTVGLQKALRILRTTSYLKESEKHQGLKISDTA